MITLGFSSRIGFSLMGASAIATNTLTFQCVDFLGVGGLIAYSQLFDNAFKSGTIQKARKLGIACTICLLPFYQLLGFIPDNIFLNVLFSVLWMISFAWIVARTSRGFTGLIGTIFELPPILYIGKISYGIYLYHNFFRFPFYDFLTTRNIYMRNSIQAIVLSTITLIFASISWFLIEKPINNLKHHFEFPPRRLSADPVPFAEQPKTNLQNV